MTRSNDSIITQIEFDGILPITVHTSTVIGKALPHSLEFISDNEKEHVELTILAMTNTHIYAEQKHTLFKDDDVIVKTTPIVTLRV